jgi:hypothetical protein
MTLPKNLCIDAGFSTDEGNEVEMHIWDDLGLIMLDLGMTDVDPVEIIEAAAGTEGDDA